MLKKYLSESTLDEGRKTFKVEDILLNRGIRLIEHIIILTEIDDYGKVDVYCLTRNFGRFTTAIITTDLDTLNKLSDCVRV